MHPRTLGEDLGGLVEQLFIPRPFGTEGFDLRVRFRDGWWTVALSELAGSAWHVLDSCEVRSSSTALARSAEMLQVYREMVEEGSF